MTDEFANGRLSNAIRTAPLLFQHRGGFDCRAAARPADRGLDELSIAGVVAAMGREWNTSY